MNTRALNRGFTLLELLVVVSIIGVLTTVILASLNLARARAQNTAAVAELEQIYTAIDAARIATGEVLGGRDLGGGAYSGITGSYHSAGSCRVGGVWIDMRDEEVGDTCFDRQMLTLTRISEASGGMLESFVSTPDGIRDPWGSPYTMDENEMENGNCNRDYIKSVGPDGVYNTPDDIRVDIPFSVCP